jgi:hypothetical protein
MSQEFLHRAYIVIGLQQMGFFLLVPGELGGPWGFDKPSKKDTQCLDHLAVLPILELSTNDLPVKISSEVLCGVFLQPEAFGRTDEALCPFDKPVGLSVAQALSGQGFSVAVLKYTCTIIVRLKIHGRSAPILTGQENQIPIVTYGYCKSIDNVLGCTQPNPLFGFEKNHEKR